MSCKAAVCGDHCALEQYFLRPSRKEPAEIARAFETMSECPNANSLAEKYANELSKSRKALKMERKTI